MKEGRTGNLNKKKEMVAKVKRNEEQKEKKLKRTNQLIQESKKWNGPVANIDELEIMMSERDAAKQKKMLKTEVTLRKLLHPEDAINRKELYRVNHLSNQEFIENMKMILSYSDQEEIKLDEDDMMVALSEEFGLKYLDED